MNYKESILKHYRKFWVDEGKALHWERGPVDKLPEDFCILEFQPTAERDMWTYATCCLSQPGEEQGLDGKN